jgi:Protein of unknown function (DUF3048) N-terminal domain/Protein of unknown function (DUF3048) C-terminal domain
MLKSDSIWVLRRLSVFAAVLGLTLTSCGGGDEEGSSDENSRDGGTLTQVSPLTGLEAPDGLPEHPVMVVKIDNTSAAEPQVGLDQADLVVEELVEGGSTRLAAFFLSRTPGEVGPVRSMRGTDVGIVSPTNGVLVASGGAPSAAREIRDAGIKAFTEGAEGYRRDSGRSVPYNLMMDLGRLAGTLQPTDPPGPYLPFGEPAGTAGTKPAGSVAVAFSSGHTTQWSFEPGTGWVREDSLAAQGADFVPDNVLALQVEVGDAGYVDPAGNPVPESKFFGKGTGVLFHDGKATPCTWTKDGPGGQLSLATQDGSSLTVPPGRTWIELVPQKGGSINYRA